MISPTQTPDSSSWRRRRLALLALAYGALSGAGVAGSVPGGIVSLADGKPFTLIRGVQRLTATRGTALTAGDMVETAAGAMLIVEFAPGAVVGIGPSSRVYLMEPADIPTLVLLRGWVKVDTKTPGKSALYRVLGTRLGAGGRDATFVMLATDSSDEIFAESGALQVYLRTIAGIGDAREAKPGQFFSRQSLDAAVTRSKPDPAFIHDMPDAFRDSLPASLSLRLKGRTSEPIVEGPVGYGDVSAWLSMPRDLRRGFVQRFRPRLKDPAFFAALDAHSSLHPEWLRILHPLPPSEND